MVTGFVIEGCSKVSWSDGLPLAYVAQGKKTGRLMCFSTCVIPSVHFWSICDFAKLSIMSLEKGSLLFPNKVITFCRKK